MKYSEFKQKIQNDQMGYKGISACDVCGCDIENIVYRYRIQADDGFMPISLADRNLCQRCHEVVQAFIKSITR